jgi:hypothetical protein
MLLPELTLALPEASQDLSGGVRAHLSALLRMKKKDLFYPS